MSQCQSIAVDSVSPNSDKSLSCNSDQSSPCLTQQCQISDLGARNDHGLPSSSQKEQNLVGIIPSSAEGGVNGVPDSTGNLISEDDTSQGPNLTAEGADDGGDVVELRLSLGSSSNANHSVGVSSALGKQVDIVSGSKLSISDLADKTNMPGGQRRVFELGSSSGPRQAERKFSNNPPAHLNATSSGTSMSSWNLPQVNFQEHPVLGTNLHSSYNAHPHPSASIYPGTSQGTFGAGIHPEMLHIYYNPGLDMRGWQSPTMFDALLASGSPHLPLVLTPSHPSPIWPYAVSAGSIPFSSPDMSRLVFSGHLPQPSVSINSDWRAGSSTERRLVPDLPDLFHHHPQHHTLVFGSYDASNLQMEPNSIFYQCSSLHWGPLPLNQSGWQQALDYPPGFLPHWSTPGSVAQNFDFSSSPYPATYGHAPTEDSLLPQPGHSIMLQNPYFPGSLIFQSGHHIGSFGVPHTSQPAGIELERDHRSMSEIVVQDMSNAGIVQQAQSFLLPPVHYITLGQFRYPEAMFIQDRLRDMRLDTDNMSYEELVNLGELIGRVTTGLSEENIMELLKRRDYEYVNGDPSTDTEACCICREEYVHGEDIGGIDCGHEFHTGCIRQWLVIKNTCPICQMKGLDA